MNQDVIKQFLEKGRKKEAEFCELFPDKEIIKATDEQDMKEHWDVQINGIKIDIKGLKKTNRSDADVNENIHWLEIKNVIGNNGWCYGNADFFAFEIKDYWILVDKTRLQNFIKENINKDKTDKPTLYYLYRRKDRQDFITLVTSYDLCYIAKKLVKKPRQIVAES